MSHRGLGRWNWKGKRCSALAYALGGIGCSIAYVAMFVVSLGLPSHMVMFSSNMASMRMTSVAMPGMEMSSNGDRAIQSDGTGDSMVPHRAHLMPPNHAPCTCPATPGPCPCALAVSPALPSFRVTLAVAPVVVRDGWFVVDGAPAVLPADPATPPPKA